MKNPHPLKILFFLFVCTRVSSKELNVSLSSSDAYPSLSEAIQALLSGQNLAEATNTITVDSSCNSTSQTFPNTQIQGTTSGVGSINITFSGLSQLITQVTDCSNLPVLSVDPNNPILLINMASFFISGFNIEYTGAGIFSNITNVGNVTFSNFCFQNTETSPLSSSSGNYFVVNYVLQFSMTNVVYFYDAYKTFYITQTSQATITNITFVIVSATVVSSNSAILVDNIPFYNTNSNITNIEVICQGTPTIPQIFTAYQTNNTSISSLKVSNCSLLSAGSNGQGIISSTCSSNFEVQDAVMQFVNFTSSSSYYFMTVYGTSTTILKNFAVDSLSSQFGGDLILLTSYDGCPQMEPLYLSASNLSLSNSLFFGEIRFIAVLATTPTTMAAINVTNTTLFQNLFANQSLFFLYTEPGLVELSTQTTPLYIQFNGLNVRNNGITGAGLILTIELSQVYLSCIEKTRLEIFDFTFVNNTINNTRSYIEFSNSKGSSLIEVVRAHVSIANLTAQDNVFYNSEFFSVDELSSFFISNSSVENLTLSMNSYFIFSNATSIYLQLESCYINNATGGTFAYVLPFIFYNNAFKVVNLQSSSTLLLSNNPSIVMQGSTFTQITTNNSEIISFGYPDNIFSSKNVLIAYSQSVIYRPVGKISIFTAAEGSLFMNDPFLYQLYNSTRTSLSLEDSQSTIFFISIVENSFDRISATNGSGATILLQDFQLPNCSINISTNSFSSIVSDGAYNLISANNLPKTYFMDHTIANTDIQGYFISYITSVITNVLFDSAVMLECQQLGFYDLQGDQCSNITIQNNQAEYLETEQIFINVACNTMTENLLIQNNTFESIVVKNSKSVIDAQGFIMLQITTKSTESSFYILKDSYFYNISLQNSQGYDMGIFQSTFLLVSSPQSSVEFSNVTFDLISISPVGSIMEFLIPSITFLNSTFRRFAYESENGALNIVFENLTIIGCTFDENNGLGSDSSGLLWLSSPVAVSEVIYVIIQNSTFADNSAAIGTILYTESLSIQLIVSESNILNNQITVSEKAIFYFSEISSSNITVLETIIIQENNDNNVTYPQYYVFSFDESDAVFEMSNCNMAATGQIIGDFIYVNGYNNIVSIFGNNLSYTTSQYNPNPSSHTASVLTPQFGLFEGNNFNATFQNLQASQIYLDTAAMFTINYNPIISSTNYACNLTLLGSIFRGINLSSSLISINSQLTSSSGPLSMLNVLLSGTLFTDISWLSQQSSSGIVSSSTALVGRNQGGTNYAVNIRNCTFSSLTGTGGLIYTGKESMYDLVLWFDDNIVNSISIEGQGAVIAPSSTQLTTFSTSLSSSSARNISFLLTQNRFSNINVTQGTTVGGGRIIYWNSQARGISIYLQNNAFLNVNCSEGAGAIIYAEYSFNLTSVLTSGGLSPEYIILISSANNSYQNLSAQNGAVICSQGDTQFLQIAFQNDSMNNIHSSQNGGVLDIEYITSSPISSSSSLRLLDILSDETNQKPLLTRALIQSSSIKGNVTILSSILTNISANNGGFIYENSPVNSLLITVTKNDFSSLSVGIRGGVFYLNQPSLVVYNNIFSNIFTGLAGAISYSASGQVNVSNLQADNKVTNSSSSTPFISFGPTNLRVILIPTADNTNNITLLPQNNDELSPYPLFSNLTSYSLSEYSISFTLVYQNDPFNFNDYEIVLDDSQNYLLSMDFLFTDETRNQKYASSNCSYSTCDILASSVLLKGEANDMINVSATYLSDYYNQSQNFAIQLRGCIVGEINDTLNEECDLCESGTYSLNLNDSGCQECPIGATCNGGSSFTINPGYYRSTISNSLLIVIPCNDSGTQCLGGDYQTICSDTYSGIVCSQCNFQNSYLSSGKTGTCTQCYEKSKLISFTVLLLIASILYQVMMILVTYNENKNLHNQYLIEKKLRNTVSQKHASKSDDDTSITINISSRTQNPNKTEQQQDLKEEQEEQQKNEKEVMMEKIKKQSNLKPGAFIVIFSAFVQISSVLSDFDVGTASTLISVSVSVGNSNTQAVFSLQCLYMLVTPDLFEGLQFETLVYIFSPLVKIAVVAVFEILRSLIIYMIMLKNHHRKRNQRNEDEEGGETRRISDVFTNRSDQIMTTTAEIATANPPTSSSRRSSLLRIGAVAAVIFLLEQPGIISHLCQYLTCTKLDPYVSRYYIQSQNSIECYTDQYNSFLRIVIIPALLFWAFLVPLVIFLVLYYKRSNLFESEALRIVLGNFYNPYSKETYYWGIVIIIFKMSIFILDSVLTSSLIIKGVVFMMIIHFYFMLYKNKPPYNHDYLNRAEKYCCLAYMMVLTMVLLRMSIESAFVNNLCDAMILVCMIGAGGYVLTNVFWLYILKVGQLLKKIKEIKQNQAILKETLGHLKNFHQELASSNIQKANLQKRRFGISLNLPDRLRGSNPGGSSVTQKDYPNKKTSVSAPMSVSRMNIPDESLISVNLRAAGFIDHSRFQEIEMKKIQSPGEEILESKPQREQRDSVYHPKLIDLTLLKGLEEVDQTNDLDAYFI